VASRLLVLRGMNITYQSCAKPLSGMASESAGDLYYLKLDLRRRLPLMSTSTNRSASIEDFHCHTRHCWPSLLLAVKR
ncbi:hypothetical protein THOM_2833, partial [Trachipleistophora hominis]